MKRLLMTCGVLAALVGDARPLYASDVADAVMRGDTAAVRALIRKKVDVNAPQRDGSTALHWAVHRDDLRRLIC